MIIGAITLPTPKRIKKRIKKYLTAERIIIYTMIGTGVAIIYFNSIPVKVIPIGTLLYCGLAYEIIERGVFSIDDPELISYLLEENFHYNNIFW